MTVVSLAESLMGDYSPEERSIPDSNTYPGRNAWVIAAINGALQEYWTVTGIKTRQEAIGALIYAPTSVEVVVAAGSDSGAITGYATWMAGCSIVIDGHDIDNQIRYSEDDGSEASFKYPYGGTTGTKTALVYHDCLSIREDVMNVYKPVRVDRQEIWPIANPDGLSVRTYGDFGSHRMSFTPPINARVADTAGTICGYSVDTYACPQTGAPLNRMVLSPAAGYAGIIDYQAKVKPFHVDSLSSTSPLPIPNEFVESILMPMARKRLATSPFFRNTDAVVGIESAYQIALTGAKALDPQTDTDVRMRPIYG